MFVILNPQEWGGPGPRWAVAPDKNLKYKDIQGGSNMTGTDCV
jgi:hypothetical protein